MNIYSLLQQAVEGHSDKVAVVDGAVRRTYQVVMKEVWALAGFLRSRGIAKGDRIAVLDDNSRYFFVAYFAAAALGVVLTPINTRLSRRELTFILNDSLPRWLLANPRFCRTVDALIRGKTSLEGVIWLGKEPPSPCEFTFFQCDDVLGFDAPFSPEKIQPDDIAQLYYTSGTTGLPKGVILTHRNVCRHAEGAVEELSLSERDVWGHIAPMFHLADAWATFAVTQVGGGHVMLPTFDAEAALKVIQDEKITISNLIPTMLNLMVKCPSVGEYDLSSLRLILSGGAPIAPEVVRRVMETFKCDYVQTYGMTETSPYLTLSLLKDHLKKLPPDVQFVYKSKTGRPFITVKLKVMRDDGESEVEPDDREVGEIWVKGETVTPGYWNRPDETAAAFREGWLKTGDLATIDAEGYVNIVDRKKDMIITGGENVYSTEVESVLYEHPAVLEAAVFGVPDEIWGEVVCAAVVLKPQAAASEKALIEHCRVRLTGFKVPQKIVILKELPKTGSGKIAKRALKERYSRGTRSIRT